MTDPVLACYSWHDNGRLVAEALVPLGYLHAQDHVFDATYGSGVWWKHWAPLAGVVIGTTDFRKTPYPDNEFDVVAYDPPYVSTGGRDTSKVKAYYNRYGILDAPRTPAGVQDLICAGLTECVRVTRKKGLILVKCQMYISSGKLWDGTYLTNKWAVEYLRLTKVDQFEFLHKPGPQPPGRRQVHARRNHSTLLVYER